MAKKRITKFKIKKKKKINCALNKEMGHLPANL